MSITTLINPTELFARLSGQTVCIVDCRFSLLDPNLEMQEYLQAHIPGSVYAHLEKDLSGYVIPGKSGRHPLPEIKQVSGFFSEIGIDREVQVIAYDSAGGSMAAARLWWLLRWLGHKAVAVLDGGWQAWLEAGYPVSKGCESRTARNFTPLSRPELVASTKEVETLASSVKAVLLDARSCDRFKGENETIDPVAGHIPGAKNAPYLSNLDENGRFRSVNQLRSDYLRLTRGAVENQVVFYCGSGVTACHNVLAYQHAGLGQARLYPGSWSEWITSAERPIETGEGSSKE